MSVGITWRVGAGVGAPSDHAVGIATGRNANKETASSALFNNDCILSMGEGYFWAHTNFSSVSDSA